MKNFELKIMKWLLIGVVLLFLQGYAVKIFTPSQISNYISSKTMNDVDTYEYMDTLSNGITVTWKYVSNLDATLFGEYTGTYGDFEADPNFIEPPRRAFALIFGEFPDIVFLSGPTVLKTITEDHGGNPLPSPVEDIGWEYDSIILTFTTPSTNGSEEWLVIADGETFTLVGDTLDEGLSGDMAIVQADGTIINGTISGFPAFAPSNDFTMTLTIPGANTSTAYINYSLANRRATFETTSAH